MSLEDLLKPTLRILIELINGKDYTQQQLRTVFDYQKSSISEHLQTLTDMGYVEGRTLAKLSYWRITPAGKQALYELGFRILSPLNNDPVYEAKRYAFEGGEVNPNRKETPIGN